MLRGVLNDARNKCAQSSISVCGKQNLPDSLGCWDGPKGPGALKFLRRHPNERLSSSCPGRTWSRTCSRRTCMLTRKTLLTSDEEVILFCDVESAAMMSFFLSKGQQLSCQLKKVSMDQAAPLPTSTTPWAQSISGSGIRRRCQKPSFAKQRCT